MGGGFLRGALGGLLVSGVVLVLVSLSMPLPQGPLPPQATPSASPDAAAPVPEPIPPQFSAIESESPAPQDTAPPPGAVTDAGTETDSPAEAKVPARPDAVPADPSPAPRLPQITETTRPAASQVSPPAAPVMAVTSDPVTQAAPPAPPPSDTVTAALPQPEATPIPTAPSPRFAGTADADAGGTPPRRIPAAPAEDRLAMIDTAPPAPPPASTMPSPSLDPLPAPAPDIVTAPDAAPAEAARPPLPQIAPIAPLPEAPGAPAPQPEAPVASRLPQILPPAEGDTAEATAPDTLLDDAPPPPTGALFANAAGFDAGPDQPIMAVVLLDDPVTPLPAEILAQISFPVSFALDPQAPDAPARAAQLRAAGFEVVILGATAIPDGATPADVAVALEAAQAALPQAVAVMDGLDGRLQSDRPVLEAVVAGLAETGHGLIAFPRGLNAAETTGRRAGLAVETAFRVLDDEDQRAPLITRYLDRAAFAAGQEGAVIVVGRTRPDTITALFSWALSGRVETVRLAPVSAVLQRGLN